MGAGLARSLVPMFVGGALDTKTDPRLVQAGSLLELENMWMLRTGELRFRNGYTRISNANYLTNPKSLFQLTGGGLGVVGPTVFDVESEFSRFAGSGWVGDANYDTIPYPYVSSFLIGASVIHANPASGTIDDVDPDCCVANGYVLTCWTTASGTGSIFGQIRENAKPSLVSLTSTDITGAGVTGRHARCAAGGSSYLCAFWADNAGTPSLKVSVFAATSPPAGPTVYTVAANLVSAAQPWFDVRAKPGSNNIMVAYRASAGGVTCLEFNPATGAVVTGPVNTAGADASMVLSWVDDQIATGSFVLATAGSGSGVVARVMNAALAITATNVIDATATAGIRNITGFINTGLTDYFVFWDVDATPTYNMLIRRAQWTGASAVTTWARSVSILSKAFKSPNGKYFMVASYASSVQPTYLLFGGIDFATPVTAAAVMSASSAGRTSATNAASLGSVVSGKCIVGMSKVTKPSGVGGAAGTSRTAYNCVFSFDNKLTRQRELGGTIFSPGGVPMKFDGGGMSWATFPIYPEAVACTPSATGSMTASGQYDYFSVYRRVDASQRIMRSPPSVATTVTLGAGDGRVTVAVPCMRLFVLLGAYDVVIEIYRRGPSASGAIAINKVGEVASNPANDTVSFIDTMSDATAASGELLYTTNGILENFPAPSHSILEVNAGRVWVVNAEDPTELWPSKEYKPGLGIGFHPLLAFRVTGDGFGGITALASMDGRLIVFKSSAIYVITGDGPNDAGQGSFNPPQCVSLNVGTVLPGSVVSTPDGIMFQSAKGIYLLSRGLTLTYAGKAVEKYTLAENVVDASLVDNVTQVRFVQASGRCLVWDYDAQRWYTFKLPVGSSSIVACANIQAGWCYALADGTVKQEVQGQYSDDGVAIIPRIGFPQMNLAGINGFQRVYGVQFVGEYVGDHVLKVDAVYDYGDKVEPQRTRVITSGPFQYEVLLASPKCSTVQVTLSAALSAGSGGFRLSGASLLVGVKRGSGVPYTKRLT